MTMPSTRHAMALAVVLLGVTACSESGTATADGGSAAVEASAFEELASDAFIWGYPLVVTQRTLQTFAALIGTNKLYNQPTLSNASSRLVVAPNQDTLYSVAVLDLRSEPLVLTIPDVHDRYWSYQFLDAWTNSFHYLGTRATDGNGGTFVITAPGHGGPLPAGSTQIASPTPTVFLLGRFLVRDEADAGNVSALVRTVVPLHVVTGSPAPAAAPSLGTAPGKPQEVGNAGAAFFDELGDALGTNPPASDFDRSELARFGPLGIGANLHPVAEARDAAVLAAFERAIADGTQKIGDARLQTGHTQNGWTTHLDIGVYRDDSLKRATVSKFGWGANVPEEAAYALSPAGPDGAPYSGQNDYVVHIDAGNLPPVDPTHGFWSVSLYGPDMFFVENSIQRYAIGDRTAGLTRNADGSLDLYVQNAEPQAIGNWLPAPTGTFVMTLRLYLPQASVLDGSYRYPQVAVQASGR